MSKLGWEAIRSLAGDRSIVIKKADKGSCVVVWDNLACLMEAEKQLKERKVYQEVKSSENVLTDLVQKSNIMFKNLRRKGIISEKELKYFSFTRELLIYENYTYYLKSISVSKMYLVERSFLTAEPQLKKYQSFLTITFIESCKMAGHISKILVTF